MKVNKKELLDGIDQQVKKQSSDATAFVSALILEENCKSKKPLNKGLKELSKTLDDIQDNTGELIMQVLNKCVERKGKEDETRAADE